MNYRQIFNKIVAQLPVIGPHSGMEGLLLAAGKKPLGWVAVVNKNFNLNQWQTLGEYLQVPILDGLVEQGQLISKDVTQKFPNTEASITIRHYAQSDKRDDLEEIMYVNELAFNKKDTDETYENMSKRYGDFLGYRTRDQYLFENILHAPIIPNSIKAAIARTNPARQAAYQQDLIRQIQNEPQSEAVKQILEIHDRLRTDFDGVRQAVIDDIAAKSAENTVPENTAKPAKVNFSCNNT